MDELGYKEPPTHPQKGGEREGLKILDRVCGDVDYVCKFNKTKTNSTTGHEERLSTTGLSAYLMCGAVAESGRLRPSGAAGANFLGGAVWGVFRENANCGDPPG